MIGIYCYEDTMYDNEIVYIGKDSNILKHKRHNSHMAPSCYNQQHINKVLQNNPDRYRYRVLKKWEKENHPKKLASVIEILYIRRHNPKFNFTKGGEGLLGRKFSKETRKKISDARKGMVFSEEHRKNLSKANKGKKLTKEQLEERKIRFGGRGNPRFKGYSRIIKFGKLQGKQRYAIVRDMKTIKQSISVDKLKTWFKDNYPDEELCEDFICPAKTN